MGILLPAPIHEDEESAIGVCAPTSSTTVALSLGDALAIATARRLHTAPGRGPAEVFKSFHPGGAIGAASSASTPMSMSTASFLTDDLSVSPLQPIPETSGATPLRLCDLLVPIDQIPTVTSSSQHTRILDVLLTAVQHPAARSWVFLSETEDEIIPPRHLRTLSQSADVDTTVSVCAQKGLPCAVSRTEWLCLPASSTVDSVRRRVAESTGPTITVIAVMHDAKPDVCLGVVEASSLWDPQG